MCRAALHVSKRALHILKRALAILEPYTFWKEPHRSWEESYTFWKDTHRFWKERALHFLKRALNILKEPHRSKESPAQTLETKCAGKSNDLRLSLDVGLHEFVKHCIHCTPQLRDARILCTWWVCGILWVREPLYYELAKDCTTSSWNNVSTALCSSKMPASCTYDEFVIYCEFVSLVSWIRERLYCDMKYCIHRTPQLRDARILHVCVNVSLWECVLEKDSIAGVIYREFVG